jgi:arylsulfatase A-like enzyme
LVVGGSVLGSTAAEAGNASPVAGKNIVIFITDQDRAVQHFPENWARENLPGLTRLQDTGVTFNNAFCNSCMCSPSRATMFTGYYPAQHGVKYTLEEDMPASEYPQVELPGDLKNLASVMSESGYDVVYKGKWHLSKPEGEEFAPSDLQKYGFDRWNPPDAGADQSIEQQGGGVNDNDGRYIDHDGDPAKGEEGVLQYLNTRTGSGKPFCLIVSLVNPHDVLLYPNNYVEGGYDDTWLEGEIELPETVDQGFGNRPAAHERFFRIFNLTGELDTDEKKLAYLNFYANLSKVVDGYLVEILDLLDSRGLTGDTVVIRTSDHGEMGLAHGAMRQKNFNAYEETLRVPMVFSNPEIFEGGTSVNALVSHVDLLPTLAGLVDAPHSARAKWAGKDYSRLVLGRSTKPVQDHIVFTFDDYQAGQKHGPYVRAPQHIVSIREQNWKIAKYYDPERKKAPEWELYDLRNDPLEKKNLAGPESRRNGRQQKHYRRLRKKLIKTERRRLQPLPNRSFSLRSCRIDDGKVVSRVRTPGRGIVRQVATTRIDGKPVVLGRSERLVRRSGNSRRASLKLGKRAARLARRGPVELTVTTTFLPAGGTPVVKRKRLRLRRRGGSS